MRRIPSILTALAAGCVLVCSQIAKCNTIEVTDATANPITGVYTYGVEITSSATLVTGDGFVIYDIPGLVSATLSLPTLPTGVFTGSESLLGNAITDPTASATNTGPLVPNNVDIQAEILGGLVDNSTLENLSFVYNGPTIPSGTEYDGTLTVTALPSVGTNTTAVVASKDSGSGGEYDVSNVTVPSTITVVGGAPVPLPASFWGGGMLMALLVSSAAAKKLGHRLVQE